MCLFGHLQIIVIKTDETIPERHAKYDPHIRIGQIGPHQDRHHHAKQNHQAAHGGRADLGDQVGLRTIGADRLAFALTGAQEVDDVGPEQQHERQRRQRRPAGAECDVAKDVEDRDLSGKACQPVEHDDPYTRSGAA
jgi:hypothetical protein